MENNLSPSIKLPILFSLVLIIGMFLGFKMSKSFQTNTVSQKGNLDNLIELINNEYVDSIDKETLYENGVDGILKTLDPHTVYIPAKNIDRVNEQLEGSFYGIGIEFFLVNDTVRVTSIIPNGPSVGSGISPGDKIIKLDDSLVAGKGLSDEEIIEKIRGQKNKELKISVLQLNQKMQDYVIKRGIVPMNSIQSFFKLNDSTGYINIKVFSENTYDEFKRALQQLANEKISNIIIDVRDNPGGYMEAVAQIADEFIAGKHTLISTIGKNQKDSIVSNHKGLFENGKVAILINENSASASEILAGIIQDLDRGIIIGRRSYGKGLVQEQFELPDHSAIRITVARYYLPSGRCIQKSYADGKEKYEEDLETRYSQGELTQGDTSQTNSHKIFYTSKKRKVYANEGITPDYFVGVDTSFSHHLIYFYTQHIAEDFTQRYYYFHKNEFANNKTIQQFHSEFIFTDKMKYDLIELLIKNNVPASVLNHAKTFSLIEKEIKASFSKLLFYNDGKMFEQNIDDKMIRIAEEKMK